MYGEMTHRKSTKRIPNFSSVLVAIAANIIALLKCTKLFVTNYLLSHYVKDFYSYVQLRNNVVSVQCVAIIAGSNFRHPKLEQHG